jgi:uncharacterized membrane protein
MSRALRAREEFFAHGAATARSAARWVKKKSPTAKMALVIGTKWLILIVLAIILLFVLPDWARTILIIAIIVVVVIAIPWGDIFRCTSAVQKARALRNRYTSSAPSYYRGRYD